MLNRIAFLLLVLTCQRAKGQLNLAWETNQAMNGGIFGYEFRLNKQWTVEPVLRFHQNRQYKFYDHREYLKRLHAFTPLQHFGLGFRINRYFSIPTLSPEFNISLSSNYSRLGSKALIFTQIGTYRDSSNFSAPIVKADVLTFKPMNVFENTLSLRAKIPLGKVVYLNYGVGLTCMYYNRIDPAMFGPGNRSKWLFTPAADLGLHIRLNGKQHGGGRSK